MKEISSTFFIIKIAIACVVATLSLGLFGCSDNQPDVENVSVTNEKLNTVVVPRVEEILSQPDAGTLNTAAPSLSTSDQKEKPYKALDLTQEELQAYLAIQNSTPDRDEPETDISQLNLLDSQQLQQSTPYRVEGGSGSLVWSRDEGVMPGPVTMVIGGAEDLVISQSFGYGETMMINQSMEDGTYSWSTQPVLELDPNVKAELQALRDSGDFEAQEELLAHYRGLGMIPTEEEVEQSRMSGTFTIKDGLVIDGNIKE